MSPLARIVGRGLVLTAVLLATAPPGWAADFEAGVRAHDAGDYATALKVFTALAEQGHAAAQVNLGAMYRNGRGVPQDYIRAHMWLNLGASQLTGDEHKRAAEARDALAEKMTPEQVARAQEMARGWKPRLEPRPQACVRRA